MGCVSAGISSRLAFVDDRQSRFALLGLPLLLFGKKIEAGIPFRLRHGQGSYEEFATAVGRNLSRRLVFAQSRFSDFPRKIWADAAETQSAGLQTLIVIIHESTAAGALNRRAIANPPIKNNTKHP